MKLLVLVNEVAGIKADQSTALLALRAASRGWSVAFCEVGGLGVDPDGAATAWIWTAAPPSEVRPWLRATVTGTPQRHRLAAGELLLLRTNAARDAGRSALHAAALGICALARDRGTVVLNDPDGIRQASSKLYLARLPQWARPETFVSARADDLAAWVRQRTEPSVLKPMSGTQGTDVFVAHPDQTGNLRQICQVVTRGGFGMAQAFVPEAPAGDTRILLIDGKVLTIDGHRAAVSRVPGKGEFRSNVAQGGTAQPATWRPAWDRLVAAVGPILAADGLWLVGLDVVGDVVVEANVAAPGGFGDAEQFSGVDFTGAVLDAMAAKASSG